MIYIIIIAVIALADLFIKDYIERYYWNNRDRYIWGKFIRIHHLNNYGGFLNYLQDNFRLLKVLSTIIFICTAVCFGIIFPKKGMKLKKLGLSLILGGAISNEYDRYNKGCVTDYFSINLPRIKKVVFNIGDFAIFTGVILTLLGGASHHNSE